MSKAMDAVKAVYLRAKSAPTGWNWIIRQYDGHEFFGDNLGVGGTEYEAWADAASRLSQPAQTAREGKDERVD